MSPGTNMYLTGADLIDMTIKQLEMLEDILSEDARSFAAQREAAGRDARRCREATDAIRTLIPKLVAARATQQPKGQMPLPGCANEDEL
jgi:hypothetical protein